MTTRKRNVFEQHYDVTPHERSDLLGQKGCVLWFVGLSGSGKSTLANALEKRLLYRRRLGFVLDGDNVRRGLNRDLGFSETDRTENLRRIAEVSGLFADAGNICICAFISPLVSIRDAARDIVGPDRFFIVHIATSLEVCEARDTKGLYKRARAGEVKNFTGISSPFEIPLSPDLSIDTAQCTVEEGVDSLMALLTERGVFLRDV